MPGKIEMKDVVFSWDAVPLLRKAEVTVDKGDVVIIGGKSGHGTSTLLELMVGLATPQSGRVLWDNDDIAVMSQSELMRRRRKIGYVFQSGALISNFTAFDNIALPLRNNGEMAEVEIKRAVRAIMEELMLFNIDTRFPEALTVWQCRAVAVARALVAVPDILFLDEPVGGIDQVTANGILNVIEKHWKEHGMAIVMVSHELSVWPHLAARRLTLDNGTLFPAGIPIKNG
jgi:phospholipid/cholesterol/gamma-HCH transport system ATP-binding protein